MKVDEAYADVLRITQETARNFAWGIRVLPGPKRRAVSALYAFARAVDDLADREEPARAELERWKLAIEELHASLTDERGQHADEQLSGVKRSEVLALPEG